MDEVLEVQAEGVDLSAEDIEHTREHADKEHEREGQVDVDVAEILDALLQAEIDAGAEHGDPDGEDDDLQRLYILIRDAEDALKQQSQQRHTEPHRGDGRGDRAEGAENVDQAAGELIAAGFQYRGAGRAHADLALAAVIEHIADSDGGGHIQRPCVEPPVIVGVHRGVLIGLDGEWLGMEGNGGGGIYRRFNKAEDDEPRAAARGEHHGDP